jgi:hypothetical protein
VSRSAFAKFLTVFCLTVPQWSSVGVGVIKGVWLLAWGMDRTDEFVSFLGVLGFDHWRKNRSNDDNEKENPRKQEILHSPLHLLAMAIIRSLHQNENLLKRIEKL